MSVQSVWISSIYHKYIFYILQSNLVPYPTTHKLFSRILYLLCSLTRYGASGACARSTATASPRRSRSVPAWNSPRSTSRTCWTPWWRCELTSARLMPCWTTGRPVLARRNIRGRVTALIPKFRSSVWRTTVALCRAIGLLTLYDVTLALSLFRRFTV